MAFQDKYAYVLFTRFYWSISLVKFIELFNLKEVAHNKYYDLFTVFSWFNIFFWFSFKTKHFYFDAKLKIIMLNNLSCTNWWSFSVSHKKKRAKQIKKLMQRGLLDPEKVDPFSLFVESGKLTYCLYKDSERILGNTFGMCILQVREISPIFCSESYIFAFCLLFSYYLWCKHLGFRGIDTEPACKNNWNGWGWWSHSVAASFPQVPHWTLHLDYGIVFFTIFRSC